LLQGPFNLYRISNEVLEAGKTGIKVGGVLERLHPNCEVLSVDFYGSDSGEPFTISLKDMALDQYDALSSMILVECR